MNEDTIQRLDREYMATFKDRDEGWWERFNVPAFMRHDPGLPFEVRGLEGMRKLGKLMSGAFSKVELPVTLTLAKGDKVLVQLRIQGKRTSMFGGIAPTGKRIDAEVMDLFRVEDGKLVEHWALMDNLTILKQIDAVDV